MRRMLALTFFVGVLQLSLAVPALQNVFEIDLSPEEALKYIQNPPIASPQLSARTAVLPLVRASDPNFRAAESGPTNGHYWRNGAEIENTNDFLEEVYDAQQYHGQDGLGRYGFGYSAPESARVENRELDGNIRGSYTYKNPNGGLITVTYWADDEGFHHEDNLPKVKLEPIQETEEVRQARLAHEAAWNEAAAAAKVNPDPRGEYDPSKYEYESSASEQQSRSVVAPARQQEARQLKPVPAEKPEDEEPQGPPRGFFYSFSYPVSVLVEKSAQGQGSTFTGDVVDHDTVGVSATRRI